MGSWTCVAQNVKGPLVDVNGYDSNQAGECILKITDQVFSLDDVITRAKPIYRYKETGHPSLQAPKIHALRDEFINLGFVRPSTSLRKEYRDTISFKLQALMQSRLQNDKIICEKVYSVMQYSY